jgi:Mn2+/Fe2+ NRAMP family transporter
MIYQKSFMRKFLDKLKWRLLVFLSVLGPGIVTAVADNDAGRVATYTVAASMYGMASQFLVIPETLILAVTQEISARIAMVTKKGLGDLIRERYGVGLSLLIFVLYFITNQGVVIQNVSGLKVAFQLFNVNWQLFLILTCLLLIFFVIFFDYKKLQRLFLIMIIFYLSYIFSAILAKPNWVEAARESFIWPTKVNVFDLTFWFSRIAVLGTTITAWGQFFVHSYIVDKKLDVRHLKYERLEIFIGAFLTSFFSWMMAVAVTYTLFVHGIKVTDGYTAALAIKPFAGEVAFLFFAIGLFGASILGLTIVPLATAYVFSEIFGYKGILDASFSKGKLFYGFFIIQILIGLILALFPQTSLFKLTLYVDFLNGAMLPVIFYFLVKFSEDKEIMGKYVISGFYRFLVRGSAVVISILVILTFFGKILKLI